MRDLRARALPLLGDGVFPAAVARTLREDPRLLQKLARRWADEGLIVEAGRRHRAVHYTLSALGLALLTELAKAGPKNRKRPTENLERVSNKTPFVKGSRGKNTGSVAPPSDHARSHPNRGSYYAGPHHLRFKSKVAHIDGPDIDPERFTLRKAGKGLRGLDYLGGHISVPGIGIVLVERHRPKNREDRGLGSLQVRFDMAALPGEDASECARRAAKAGRRALYWVARKYGLVIGEPVHGDNPLSISGGHHAIAKHPIAKFVTERYGRRVVVTSRGELSADRSHWGGEVEGNHEADIDDLLRVGQSARETLEEVQKMREDLQALWEQGEARVKREEALLRGQGALEDLGKAQVEALKGLRRALPEAVAAAIREMAERTTRPPDPPVAQEPKSDPGGMFG